jgi:hypothetical protein
MMFSVCLIASLADLVAVFCVGIYALVNADVRFKRPLEGLFGLFLQAGLLAAFTIEERRQDGVFSHKSYAYKQENLAGITRQEDSLQQ